MRDRLQRRKNSPPRRRINPLPAVQPAYFEADQAPGSGPEAEHVETQNGAVPGISTDARDDGESDNESAAEQPAPSNLLPAAPPKPDAAAAVVVAVDVAAVAANRPLLRPLLPRP